MPRGPGASGGDAVALRPFALSRPGGRGLPERAALHRGGDDRRLLRRKGRSRVMIICPILSQQHRAEDGTVAWEHHECLREGCMFWASEAEDCGIRASGLQILKQIDSPQREAAPPLPDFVALLSGPIDAMAGMKEKIEEIADKTASANRDLGISLLEGVAALEQPVHALREDVESLKRRLEESETVLARALALVEEQQRRDDERVKADRLEEARACNTRGTALCHRELYEAAEESFRKAIDLDPSMAEAHSNLGIVLGRQERADEAAAAFEKALEIRPDLAGALNNLGFLASEAKDFDRAIELFRKAALHGADSSVAYTNLGNALHHLGRDTEAVEAWRKAMERDPLNVNAERSLRMFEGVEA